MKFSINKMIGLESEAHRPPLHISHCWRGSPFLLCLKWCTAFPQVTHKYVIWWMQFSRKLHNTQCVKVDGNPVICIAGFSGSNHGIKKILNIFGSYFIISYSEYGLLAYSSCLCFLFVLFVSHRRLNLWTYRASAQHRALKLLQVH